MYKIVVSVAFGLLGFCLNFYPLHFFLPPHTASLVLGLVFPMLISLAWGWKYALISLIIGLGGQTMWFLWVPTNGWAPFVAIPVYNLWVVWHGWCAEKKNRLFANFYLMEIGFRIFNTIILYTIFRWVWQFNPSPWAPTVTLTTAPLAFVNFIAIKQFAEGLIILLAAHVLLNFRIFQNILLIERKNQVKTGYIISAFLLFGFVFWFIAGFSDYLYSSAQLKFLLSHQNQTLAEAMVLQVPGYELFTRTLFILTCTIAGLVVSKYVSKFKKSEVAREEAYEIVNKSNSVTFLWANSEGWPVEFVSQNVQKLFGYSAEDFVSGNIAYLANIHPEDHERVSEEVAFYSDKEDSQDFEHEPYRIITNNNDVKWVSDSTYIRRDEQGKITHYQGIVEDITSRKQAEEENAQLEVKLRQAYKMEAVGTLAGGIAHDFNNILSIILGYAELAKDEAPPDSISSDNLDHVLEAAHRAEELVRQILSFSRQAQVGKIALKPQTLLIESLKMIRSSIPTTIEIQQNISPDCGTITVDPTQLHQILMNLCTNAFHAMEDQGGTLKVTLQVADTVPLELQEEKTTDDEIFIELSVSDTGQGIGPDIISHIFDPYFTTKEQGKGTGMGLAIIYGIVKDYGGTITVDTQLGKGTTFHVYLPQRTGTAAPAPVDEELSFEGKERILFVDDEEILAAMGKVMLERLGYHVTAKQSSLEALEAFQNQADEFDLVVTDLTMPDITGVELARMMLQIRPDIPIILCTGYSSTVNEDVAKAQGVKGFALKPLTRSGIAKLVRQVLDEGKLAN